MRTEQELDKRIEELCETYHGSLEDLYRAVGMMVVGRYFGWRVMRLVSTRADWSNAIKMFGDPKTWMADREKFWHRSYGLHLADKIGRFWDVIKGTAPIPSHDRKSTMDNQTV